MLKKFVENRFFDQNKLADFEQRVNAVNTIDDVAERLLSYQALEQEAQSSDFFKPRSGKKLLMMLLSSPFVMVGGMLAAPLGLPIYIGFGVSFIGGAMAGAGFIALNEQPVFKLLSRVRTAAGTTIAAARLEDMRHSPKLDAALDAFPALQERFRTAAERARLLEAPTPASPQPLRLTLDKPVQHVPALPAPAADVATTGTHAPSIAP